MPSRNEGLPVALLEAGAAGVVPVVSNLAERHSGCRHAGRNGYRPEPGDIDGFAEAIARPGGRPRIASSTSAAASVSTSRRSTTPSICTAAYEQLFADWRRVEAAAAGPRASALRQPPRPAVDPQSGRARHSFSVGEGVMTMTLQETTLTTPTTPTVSVLMTAYNREHYIAEAIESVLTQTYTDFELVIVDDGSKDNTVEVASRYLQDPRVRRGSQREEPRRLSQPQSRRVARARRVHQVPRLRRRDVPELPGDHGAGPERLSEAPRSRCPRTAPGTGGRCPMLLTPRMSYQREFLGAGLVNQGPAAALFRTRDVSRDRPLSAGGRAFGHAVLAERVREASDRARTGESLLLPRAPRPGTERRTDRTPWRGSRA